MKKLHLLFLKSFIGPFVGTFFISMFLFLMWTLWKYLEDLVGKGLELSIILEFIFYSTIHLIPLALPLAILLSSIMTFGNLGERYELAAIKSAGVSLVRAMLPMFIMCIVLGIAAFYTSNALIPKANLSWGALMYDVVNKKPAMNITNNVFYKDIKGYAIRVGKKHSDNQTIEDILIYVYNDGKKGNNNIIIAKKGKMTITEDERYLILQLEDGKQYQEMVEDENYAETMPHNTMSFERYEMAIDLSDLQFNRTRKELFKDDYRMLNIDELQVKIDSVDQVLIRKHNSLERYLQPYFHMASDSIELDSSLTVDMRLDTILYYTKLHREKYLNNLDTDTSWKDSISDDLRRSLTLSPQKKLQLEAQQGFKISKEKVIDNALSSIDNMERITRNNIDDIKKQREMKARYEAEWHKKFTLALSCLLLFFIGAPLGAIIRKGGFGIPLALSFLLFIIFNALNVIGEKMVKQDTLDALSGMWLSTMILLPVAIFLTHKSNTDSRLFDSDFYKRLLRLPRRFRREDSSNIK